MSNGEAFFQGPNAGASGRSRPRGRRAIPSRDALPPSCHIMSSPAVCTGDEHDRGETHTVVLSLPLPKLPRGASVGCEMDGQAIECSLLRAEMGRGPGHERGRIIATVTVRPPSGAEGVAFFEPKGVALPRDDDAIIPAPLILCAENQICAAVNRAFYSPLVDETSPSDPHVAFHRDDAIVALGRALVGEAEPHTAAMVRAWACCLPSDAPRDSRSSDRRDDEEFEEQGSIDSGNSDSHAFHAPVDALASRIFERHPPGSAVEMATSLLSAVKSGRVAATRLAVREAERLAGTSTDGPSSSSREPGHVNGTHATHGGAGNPAAALALIPVVGVNGEVETALHAAAALDNANVALQLLASPTVAKPYMWSTYRVPSGDTAAQGRTAAEVAGSRAAERGFAVSARHPSLRVEKVLADAAALTVKRLMDADDLIGSHASVAELANEARRRQLAFAESSDGSPRSVTSSSSLDDVERDDERDALVLAKLADPHGATHLVNTFVRGKRNVAVDASLDAKLRGMRHEVRATRSAKSSPLRLGGKGGRKRRASLATMAGRLLACCVPDGNVSSLAPGFWLPHDPRDSRAGLQVVGNSFTGELEHPETALRRRLGTLAATPLIDIALALMTIVSWLGAILRANNWVPRRVYTFYTAVLADPEHGTSVLSSHLAVFALTLWGVYHVIVRGDRDGTWYKRRELFVVAFRLLNPIAMRSLVVSPATAQLSELAFMCDVVWSARFHLVTCIGAAVFCVRYERLIFSEVIQAIATRLYEHVTPKGMCPGMARARDWLILFRIFVISVPMVAFQLVRERRFRRLTDKSFGDNRVLKKLL